MGFDYSSYIVSLLFPHFHLPYQFPHILISFIFSDIAPVGKKAQGIMADGQADDDEDEGVPEEKRLADDVRSDAKVKETEIKILKIAVN